MHCVDFIRVRCILGGFENEKYVEGMWKKCKELTVSLRNFGFGPGDRDRD